MGNTKKGIAKEINLKEIFSVIKKRLWIIAIITALASTAGYLYGEKDITLLYQSSARIIIGKEADMNTLQVILKDPVVLEKVVEKLDLKRSPESLANQINVGILDSSKVVNISVIDTDPKRAADIANTTAEEFKIEITRLLDFNDMEIFSPAKINPAPINEEENRSGIIGFVFGLFAGIGFVFFLDSLDDTIRSKKDVEDFLDLPVLGRISKMNKKNIQKHSTHQIDIPRGDNGVPK
ncbi:Wzz/FepE/Etk N-terminal domain-containing protein [Bacillus sp. ISL-37]|uniref:YveK family protein n=1 Tax=Bacillus sp. ISL-37 TaxID=2819123 RepID=UPI001BEA92DD|nr:Wzz/FepE/Etk N-terminal domain-containing protein [Bacillus sp. ISL-37]MBT2686193.1 capsular biosynthesis protein [Bacillus sp. ISL-37]